MLYVVSHNGPALSCCPRAGDGGSVAGSSDDGPACAAGLEEPIGCLPSSLTQICGSLQAPGSAPPHPYLSYIFWFLLAVRLLGEPGVMAVSSCSWQLFGSNAQEENLFSRVF